MDVICIRDKIDLNKYYTTEFYIKFRNVSVDNVDIYINNLLNGESIQKPFPSEEAMDSQRKCIHINCLYLCN